MTFIVYPDSAGEYRWQLRASNGEPMGDSGEGYVSERDCMDAIETILNEAAAGRIGVTRGPAPV